MFDDLEINKRKLKNDKPLNYILTTVLEIEFIIWRVFIFFNDKILKLNYMSISDLVTLVYQIYLRQIKLKIKILF